MARFCTLFSGSSGNCTYIGGAAGGILIDAGSNAKQIRLALESAGIEPDSIKAIFITHEHTDHISGLRVFASRQKTAVYCSAGTLSALEKQGNVDGGVNARVIDYGGAEAAGMLVTPFYTSHDCRQSNGYIVKTADGRKLAIATDLGYVSDEVRAAMQGSDLVMLESNHDVGMLRNGSYPYHLKRRIMGNTGHLSNEACAAELPELVRSGVTRIILAHLSRENNLPELALQESRCTLQQSGMTENLDYILRAAPRTAPDKMMVF